MQVERLVALAADLRLTTERLVIRRVAERDVATAIAHEEDRRIMRWIRDALPRDEVAARVRDTLGPWDADDGRWLVLTVAARADDAMLGIVCFRVTNRDHETVEVGYRLHPEHQRQGLAFEAMSALINFLFDAAAVRRIVALCAADNEASWRLMSKLGMQREGRLREHSKLAGTWCDELVYGLLRREWVATTG